MKIFLTGKEIKTRLVIAVQLIIPATLFCLLLIGVGVLYLIM